MQLGSKSVYNLLHFGKRLSQIPKNILGQNLYLQQVSFTSMDRYVTRKVLAEDEKDKKGTKVNSPEKTSPQQKRLASHDSKWQNKFQVDKDKYLNMSINDKRKVYKCKKFVELSDIPTWQEFFLEHEERLHRKLRNRKLTRKAEVNETFNKKLTLWRGDITALEIDSIANAANNSLLGGGGVDGAIHSAAGSCLVAECRTLGGCDTGDAKITGGYKLPSKYVIHTVGPIGENPAALKSCYVTCLNLMVDNKLRSIAFPCISTGIYGYPSNKAADVVLSTMREWLEESDNADKVDRIIFCLFMPQDVLLYEELMQLYFPVPLSPERKGKQDDVKSDPEESEKYLKESSEKKENTTASSYVTRKVLKDAESERNSTPDGKEPAEKVSEVKAGATSKSPPATTVSDTESAAKRKSPINSEEESKDLKTKKTDENNTENDSPSSDNKESQDSPMECETSFKTKL